MEDVYPPEDGRAIMTLYREYDRSTGKYGRTWGNIGHAKLAMRHTHPSIWLVVVKAYVVQYGPKQEIFK